MATDGGNGWGEYGKHVLTELERLSEMQKEMREEIAGLRVDVARITCLRCPFDREEMTGLRIQVEGQRVKQSLISGFFGVIGGAIVGLGAYLLKK